VSHDVDVPVKQSLEILGQTHDIRRERSDSTSAAGRDRLPHGRRRARDRSEHAYVPRTMSGGNVDDRVALLLKVHGSGARDIVDRHHRTARRGRSELSLLR